MEAMQNSRDEHWDLLVDHERRRRALECVRTIARDVSRSSTTSGTLAHGCAGQALLFAYLHRAFPTEGWEPIAHDKLGRAARSLAEQEYGWSLYGGFTGVAWTFRHIERQRLLSESSWATDDLDQILTRIVSDDFAGHFDLVYGLAGLGAYACESDDAVSGALLREVTRLLFRSSETREPGRALGTPDGGYDLGIAHGSPGTWAPLASATLRGIEGAQALLRELVQWQLAQRLAGSVAFAYRSESALPARSAWCYGDPGVALALYAASAVDARWAEVALEIARGAARRPTEQCGAATAGLCHGSAGLLHLYNRLYQATKDRRFADAARFWLDRTLDRWEARADAEVVHGEPRWSDAPSLITGAVGVALALLAAATEVTPAWDRMLGISLS
jgi:lantibiotic modifying enzyme